MEKSFILDTFVMTKMELYTRLHTLPKNNFFTLLYALNVAFEVQATQLTTFGI